MRRWIDLCESPIDNIGVDPNFDANEREMISKFTGYDMEQKHWPDADKITIRDNDALARIRAAFIKVPHRFNLYFWQSSDPDYDRTLQQGIVTPEWVKNVMGQDAFEFVCKNVSGITVIMSNNLSDDGWRSIRSPWMIGHRIAHTLLGGMSSSAAANHINHEFDEFIRKVVSIGYGVPWPEDMNPLFAEDYLEAYGEVLGAHLGTMRSARQGKLTQASEWRYETFTQYLLTGDIPMRSLPSKIHEEEHLTTDPVALAKLERLLAEFPTRLKKRFDLLLRHAHGRIYVE